MELVIKVTECLHPVDGRLQHVVVIDKETDSAVVSVALHCCEDAAAKAGKSIVEAIYQAQGVKAAFSSQAANDAADVAFLNSRLVELSKLTSGLQGENALLKYSARIWRTGAYFCLALLLFVVIVLPELHLDKIIVHGR